MTNISTVNGLPDIVSIQKKVYPLLYSDIVAVQPTSQPIATVYGFKKSLEADDGSGWSKMSFRLDRWHSQVQSNKIKTDITTEALTDLRAVGGDEDMVVGFMADWIADEINQDLLDKLSKISTVGAAITIPGAYEHEQGRALYGVIHRVVAELESTTGATGSYVVVNSRLYGLLLASGWVRKVPETNISEAKSGIIVCNDKYAVSDYFIVGVKEEFGSTELSSLVFSPFEFDGDEPGALAYQVTAIDPKSLHQVYGVIARYAVTSAPLENNTEQTTIYDIDWNNLTPAHKSKLSVKHTVTVQTV